MASVRTTNPAARIYFIQAPPSLDAGITNRVMQYNNTIRALIEKVCHFHTITMLR